MVSPQANQILFFFILQAKLPIFIQSMQILKKGQPFSLWDAKGPKNMGNYNHNKKTEDNGFKLRPIFPQDKIEWHKQQTIGKTEEDRLEELYSKLSDWLSEVKVLENRGSIELLPYLKQALAKAKSDGRVPDCSDNTVLRLGELHNGPDLLLFFVRKCPHARDSILRGELPPHPWHISQTSGHEQNQEETEQKDEGSKIMIKLGTCKEIWEAIRSEYDISKRNFGKKINFVSDPFKRKIIFRDVEHAFVLASHGFSKPAVILAGGVIEELLKQYLKPLLSR